MTTVDFNGKWKLVRSEKFEEFLEKMGVNWMMRKMASKTTPTTEIVQDGDNFTVTTHTGFMTREFKFTIGVETVTDHMNHKMKSLVNWDDGKLVAHQSPAEEGKGKEQDQIRELTGDGEMLMTIKVEDLVCKRWFKKEA